MFNMALFNEPIDTSDVEQKEAAIDEELQYWADEKFTTPKVHVHIAKSLKKEKLNFINWVFG